MNILQFFKNCAAQYTGLTLGEVANYRGDIGPSVLLAPVQGLGTSYQFIRAAKGPMERSARIANVASFMGSSFSSIFLSLELNVAMGASIACFISYMRSVLEKTKKDDV
jgi:hypothetical protein